MNDHRTTILLSVVMALLMTGCQTSAPPAERPPQKQNRVETSDPSGPSAHSEIEDDESGETTHEDYYRRGYRAFRKMNFSEAIEQFSKAIEQKPSFTDAFNQRGLVFARIGRYREAVRDFSRALKQDPEHKRARHNRGFALLKAGRPEQAIDDLTAALEIDPEYQSALHNRGLAYLQLKKYDRAIRDFNRSLEIEPTYLAYTYTARAHALRGNLSKSIDVLNRAIEQFPNSASLHRTRAGYHRQAGNNQKAARDLKKFRSLAGRTEEETASGSR